MRVVVDTNVLVSGIINPFGAPGRIFEAVLEQTVTALVDDRILSEYRLVLNRPFLSFRQSDTDRIVEFLALEGEYVIAPSTGLMLPDQTDLPFLEVAMAGCADALVTGNSKHFRPKIGKHEIRICSPAEFARLLT